MHNNYTSTLPEARKKRLSNCPKCHKSEKRGWPLIEV